MTKTELNNKCKEIRDKYRNGEKITNEDKDWLIKNVFSYHGQWGWWNKQGVDYITVDKMFKNGGQSRCFFIHFINPIDKKCADISWNKAIKNIKSK